MKTTLEKLRAKLAAVSRADLELLTSNVVISLYGTTDEPWKDDSPLYLDSQNEWTQDTIENVASDLHNAGLNPEQIG